MIKIEHMSKSYGPYPAVIDISFEVLRGEIVGFQLRYDKQQDQRAVTWHYGSGFTHHRVDDGENRPGRHKLAPILVPDGVFQHEKVAEAFRRESIGIEEKVAAFVYEKLMEFPTVRKDA